MNETRVSAFGKAWEILASPGLTVDLAESAWFLAAKNIVEATVESAGRTANVEILDIHVGREAAGWSGVRFHQP